MRRASAYDGGNGDAVMRVILRSTLPLVLCVLLAAHVGAAQTPPAGAASSQKRLKIERGTELVLTLEEPVSSATAKRGQTVRLRLAAPWLAEGYMILPKGSSALGKVSGVQRAVPGKKDGHVVITAGSMQLRSGRSVALDLWLPDRDECDGERAGCAVTYAVFGVLVSPILALEIPILLVESPRLIHKAIREHEGSHAYRIQAVDSTLPAGTGVRALTKHAVRLRFADVAASSPSEVAPIEPHGGPTEQLLKIPPRNSRDR